MPPMSAVSALELHDFVVAQLLARQQLDKMCTCKAHVALQNQRDDLLAFSGVLDGKFETIAPQTHRVPMYLVG